MVSRDDYRDAYGRFMEGRELPDEIEQKRLASIRRANIIKADLRPTPTLAYILGVMLGDGCSDHHRCYYRLRLKVTKKEFAEEFARNLKKLGLRPSIGMEKQSKHAFGNKSLWVTTAHSKRFYEWFSKLSLANIREILLMDIQNIRGFLKGFYESEGCCSKKKKYLNFSNTQMELILLVQEQLVNLGYYFHFRSVKKQTCIEHRLEIFKQDEVKRFLLEMNPCIKRGD